MTERAKGQSIASSKAFLFAVPDEVADFGYVRLQAQVRLYNCQEILPSDHGTGSPELLVTPTEDVLRSELAKSDRHTIEAVKTHGGYVRAGESVTVTTTTKTTQVIEKKSQARDDPMHRHARPSHNISAGPPPLHGYQLQPNGQAPMEPGWAGLPPASPQPSPPMSPQFPQFNGPILLPPPPLDLGRPPSPAPFPLATDVLEDDNSLVVGLKVFTKKTAPTVITGRLKDGSAASPRAPTRYN